MEKGEQFESHLQIKLNNFEEQKLIELDLERLLKLRVSVATKLEMDIQKNSADTVLGILSPSLRDSDLDLLPEFLLEEIKTERESLGTSARSKSKFPEVSEIEIQETPGSIITSHTCGLRYIADSSCTYSKPMINSDTGTITFCITTKIGRYIFSMCSFDTNPSYDANPDF